MELLLNLVWIALAITAFVCFVRRARSRGGKRTDYGRSLFALACILLILFPIISASDDLHPAQAVVEEPTKRIQQLASPFQMPASHSIVPLLPLLFSLWLALPLTLWQWRKPVAVRPRAVEGFTGSFDGRSPPLFRG